MSDVEKVSEAPPVDLAGLDAVVEGIEAAKPCQIRHPATNAALSMVVHVVGTGSRKYRRAERWLRERQIERLGEGDYTDEMRDADLAGFVARLCTGWSNFTVDGEPLGFSTENAVRIFGRFPFILDQVDVFAGQKRNFTTG